ncbi:MAG: DUF3552 domain-containing protein, partial [Flavobacteriales bacterium]|nr:DUF3552 domain-containing protein [Flavobacteriales bacterium]
MDLTSILIGILAGVAAGGGLVYVLLNGVMKKRTDSLLKEAELEAENIKKEKIIQAKEKFLQLKEEHEKDVRNREKQVQQGQDKIKQREQQISRQQQELANKEKQVENLTHDLEQKLGGIERRKEEVEKMHQKQVSILEKAANLNADDAKKQLMDSLRDEARTAAMSHIKEVTEEAKLTANKEAKRIVIQTIQRVATEHAIENSVSVFHIDNDDVKGRVIGREGRNIRTLEELTGVEIIVDDTPGAIILSCFDPVRREMARLALHQLVKDGRIHPGRIEEIVAKTKRHLDE